MMDNELIKWLLSSLLGETAVAPFTTLAARDDKFKEIAAIVPGGAHFDWSRRRISLESHGSIDFISMAQGPRVIKGRLWNHSFELQGPHHFDIDDYDFMQTLSSRVVPKDAELTIK